MLKVSGLTREFATAEETVVAVDDVTFDLADGVFASVVGKSGSGKSTLLSLLGTLDKPTAGTIEIGGTDVTELTDAQLTAYRRDSIGFVFQSYNLIPNLTAHANVALPMEFAGVPKTARDARAAELLDQVGLSVDKQRRRPGHLSGGEQQRVAIARALANKPALILADEPTGNLDTETGAHIVSLLRDLARCENVTILAVTHDTELAALADRTFQLRDGRMEEARFPKAVADAGATYDAWLSARHDADALARFTSAVALMIEVAPAGRRISTTKIRERFAEAAGDPEFEAVLGEIAPHHDDLLEAE